VNERSPGEPFRIFARKKGRGEFDPYRPGEDAVPVFYPADAFYIPFAGFGAVVRGGPWVRVWRIEAR
jgi:hypothetical protein